MAVQQHGYITVVESVYHQQPSEQPTVVTSRFIKKLTDDDQPFERRMRVGEGWQLAADACWINHPGMLMIENREGNFTQVNPTEAERQDVAGRILDFVFADTAPENDAIPHIIIPPTETSRFQPHALGMLFVRCRSGCANYKITALPC